MRTFEQTPAPAESVRVSWRATITAGLLCGIFLVLCLRLWRANLWVPFTYESDALYFLSVAKGIASGQLPWHNAWLGAPFGADWRDFPLNNTLDMLALRVLAFFAHGPGILVNAIWLMATVFASMTAAWSLQRLRIPPPIAAACGVIYALEPFAFRRGVVHLNLVFYLVPLLSTGAIELASGRLGRARIPGYLLLACVAQGLSYIYNSFFICFFFLAAAGLAWLARRDTRELLTGSKLMATVVLAAAVNLSPYLVYRASEGVNPVMTYKNPVEAEVYSLKIRHLLTPVRNHLFPPFRAIERRLADAHFHDETEGSSCARLGTVMSVGFLFLLGFTLLAAARGKHGERDGDDLLGACGALTVAGLLLATYGGFGVLFNVFVADDVRAYNRISIFLSFFAAAAAATLLDRAWKRWRQARRPSWMAAAALALLVPLAVADQADAGDLLNYGERGRQWREDAVFVQAVEADMPAGCMVFQLPYFDFPLDTSRNGLSNYDESRAYLHSVKCRWSWGAMSGRDGEWNRYTASLPLPEMAAQVARAGFTGLWLDVSAYPADQSPAPALTALLGVEPRRDASDRILFYDLAAFRAKLIAGEDPARVAAERERALNPLLILYSTGFFPEETGAEGRWRWSDKASTLRFSNRLDRPRKVRFSASLQTFHDAPQPLLIWMSGADENVAINATLRPMERTFTIPPRSSAEIEFSDSGLPVKVQPGDVRAGHLYFRLVNPVASDAP